MSESLEKTIEQFQKELVDLGFQKWDVDKDYKHRHIFQYQDIFNRGLFVEVFDAQAYENRKGDVNIHLNPFTNPHKYTDKDHLFYTLAWHVLQKAGITKVISCIDGKEKGELCSLSNTGMRYNTQSDGYGIRMIDCDTRSLNPNSKKHTPDIIQEIKYLQRLIDIVTNKTYEFSKTLFDQAKNYPIQLKK